MIELEILKEYDGQRLDRTISSNFHIPYAFLQKLFRLRKINVNGEKAKDKDIVHVGDVVCIFANLDLKNKEGDADSAELQRRLNKLMSMKIYEDNQCIIINKPAGYPVQRGSKITFCVEDLINAYEKYDCKLVHRLDKDTSGVLVIAKGLYAARRFAEAFRNGSMHKKYWAIVNGNPNQKHGIIKTYLKKTIISNEEKVVVVDSSDPDGAYSETSYNVLRRSHNRTLLELFPHTGRTHQLRVHCAEILKTPIVGDKKYGKDRGVKNMYLHAYNIQNSGLKLDVTADIPEYFKKEIADMQDVRNQAHLVFLSSIIR